MSCDHTVACAVCREGEQRLAREWQDSILLHEQRRDDEHRLRDALERRAEKAEAEVARLRAALEEIEAVARNHDETWIARIAFEATAGDRSTSATTGGET